MVAKNTLLILFILIATALQAQQNEQEIRKFEDLILYIDNNSELNYSFPDELNDYPIQVNTPIDLNNLQELKNILEKSGIKIVQKDDLLIFKKIRKAQALMQPTQLTGYVRDAGSGESLIGVNMVDLNSGKGVITNEFGYFSLRLTGDSVLVSYIGYKNQYLKPENARQEIIVNLEISPVRLEEVVVKENVQVHEVSKMSAVKLTPQQIKSLPVLMGEPDVLKSLQLMPGIQSGNEGTSGLYVRGGGADQNLILLDGVPVYNANHLFGFFSVFNTDALNNVEMIKGGFPARYGGRISSVIDIQMKEGNLNQFGGEGSLGLIASKLTVEGPMVKGKSSYMISGRRTYLDLFTVPFSKIGDQQDINAYNFWDLNGKVNYILSPKDRIYLSFYLGNDKFYGIHNYDDEVGVNEKEKEDLKWGNVTSAFRWNHKLSDRLFSNLTLTWSLYRFNLGTTIDYQYSAPYEDEADIYRENKYYSNIADLGAKMDYNFYINNNHMVRYGVNFTHHSIHPGESVYKSKQVPDTTFGTRRLFLDEFFVYAEDDFSLTPSTKINLGLHFSGAFTESKVYPYLQPRVSVNQKLSSRLSLKLSYARMAQYIHLLVNSGIGLPTDLWVPSTDQVKPQQSDQVAFGIAASLLGFELSTETYYKYMKNLVEYKDGAGFLDITNEWVDKVEFGSGYSYGVEVLLQRKLGRSTGWIGYAWSKSNRDFKNLNFGKEFPYRYDRRHDISLVYNYKLNERIDLGAVWVYGTGNPVTLPASTFPKASWDSGQPDYEGFVKNYPGRNSSRMKDYHRLDISISFTKEKKWGQRKWVFGLYNAYSHLNPTFISFSDESPSDRGFNQVSLFPVIPNVSYQFKF